MKQKNQMVIAICILFLSSCGTSETIMKDRFSSLPTSVLCQKLVDGNLASWQEKWAGQVISTRGGDCQGFKPSPRATTQRIIIKNCSKNYGGGFWGGLSKGLDGC